MIVKTLVLHICCAPDEAWVVKNLRNDFHLHCFFCNPNIAPLQEYELRKAEAKKVADYYNVPFTADEYLPNLWEDSIVDVSNTPEGGERCRRCFSLRLQSTAVFCNTIGCMDFTTVMSISPHKNIRYLNEIGTKTASGYGLTYHCYDFKKRDGFRSSILLSKELGLYRQDYCGCRLSKAESKQRKQVLHEKNLEKHLSDQDNAQANMSGFSR